jgi:hypothetical protein
MMELPPVVVRETEGAVADPVPATLAPTEVMPENRETV